MNAMADTGPRVRDVRGFLDYEVCENGSVYSVRYDYRQDVRPDVSTRGVKSVRFASEGRMHRRRLAEVVAAAFLPRRPSMSHSLVHLDGDQSNCCASNLAWMVKK